MRRYKLAIHILVILAAFSFVSVLAVPVPVQEVREACTDVVDGGEDMIIVSGKRAEEGQALLTQASPGQGSPSTSDYASGVHQETINPSSSSGEIQKPPYTSGGTDLPWYGPGDIGKARPAYASGGTELP